MGNHFWGNRRKIAKFTLNPEAVLKITPREKFLISKSSNLKFNFKIKFLIFKILSLKASKRKQNLHIVQVYQLIIPKNQWLQLGSGTAKQLSKMLTN